MQLQIFVVTSKLNILSNNLKVQTEDQYIFIHDALLEAINCGNTELSAHNLFNHLHKLTSPEGDSPVTGMEMEFKVKNSHKMLKVTSVLLQTINRKIIFNSSKNPA